MTELQLYAELRTAARRCASQYQNASAFRFRLDERDDTSVWVHLQEYSPEYKQWIDQGGVLHVSSRIENGRAKPVILINSTIAGHFVQMKCRLFGLQAMYRLAVRFEEIIGERTFLI